jgi:hypothetical protein
MTTQLYYRMAYSPVSALAIVGKTGAGWQLTDAEWRRLILNGGNE